MPDHDLPQVTPSARSKLLVNVKGWTAILLAYGFITLLVGGSISLANFWQEHVPGGDGPGAIGALIAAITFGVGFDRGRRLAAVFFFMMLFMLIFGTCLAIFHGWGGYVVVLAVLVVVAGIISTSRQAAHLSSAQRHLDQALSSIRALSHGELDPADEDVQALSQQLDRVSQQVDRLQQLNLPPKRDRTNDSER